MKRLLFFALVLTLCCAALPGCAGQSRKNAETKKAAEVKKPAAAVKVDRFKYQLVSEYKHDAGAYTQGLFFHDGKLYESAGQYGESSLRIVDLETGKVLKQKSFARRYFLEGACVLDGRLYVLTWKENVCFICDPATLEQRGQLRYSGEGWGLTTDGKSLIMSDGTAVIRYRNPQTFAVERELTVRYNGQDLAWLNELEYFGGHIWANVYGLELLVCIDPETGNVVSDIDCRGILPANLKKPTTDVFNGIAYDAEHDALYVTGKYWPKLFRIRKTK
jgi:glutamine cyclotransferase